MIELIAIAVLFCLTLGFVYFMMRNQQKQSQHFMDQMQKNTQMMMAGSFQEWNRVKKGLKPLPNKVKNEPNLQDLSEDNKIPFEDIRNVSVDGGPKREIKLYA